MILLHTPEIPCSISPAIRLCDESIVPVCTIVLVCAAQPVLAQADIGSRICSDIADTRRLLGQELSRRRSMAKESVPKMNTWLGSVLGLVAGLIASLTYDTPGVVTAMFGALAGAFVCHMLKVGSRSKEEAQGARERDQGLAAVRERVGQLEIDVAVLRQRLVQIDRPRTEAPDARVPKQDAILPTDVRPTGMPAMPGQPENSGLVVPKRAVAVAGETATADLRSPIALVPVLHSPQVEEGHVTDSAEPATDSGPEGEPVHTEPGIFERVFRAATGWLLGGNTVVCVGIVVLLFGVAFLLKYAADNSLLPVEFRLAAVAVGATAMLIAGQRIGARRGAYGLVLQGGGVGILYLIVFAAARLYSLLPTMPALALMIVICALSAYLAVRQDARSLAFMGSAGGFLAPILLSSGGGNHVALFGYYAILNIGIISFAWFKAWRPLNLLGFVFTFTIGAAWGSTAYRSELLRSTEPFLVLFFLIYVGIGLLYAVKREIALKSYIDGTLVFGTPIVVAGLQAALVRNVPFGLAWSAVVLAAFYLGVALWLKPRRARLGLLFDATLALGVIFATLALPFAFSGPTTSAAWALEGAALVWVGVRERRLLPFGFGIVTQLAAACAFAGSVTTGGIVGGLPVLNGSYIATLLIALAGLFTGWWLHARSEARAWHAWMGEWGIAAAAWGLLWWLGGGIGEIVRYAEVHAGAHQLRFETDATLLFAVATAWLAHIAHRRLIWPLAEWVALALAPVLTVALVRTFDAGAAPLSGPGALAWPLALAGAYGLMRRQEREVGDKLMAPSTCWVRS
ncbi:DUF2339 domain-containing protein [Paraburkholderia sp. J41]|uniref:DUF2339 domain-containing protein n=1 Tax=Paraburkholderia sp. J41 TaxID=2805433 RepID=UPI002AC32DFA|nr:DUF2339 domain-containing protein [Paraburkholderia sp. J41]